jgi:AraC-like DNA-binding protein
MKFVPDRKVIALALPLLSEGEIKLAEGVRKGLAEHDRTEEVIILGGGYETPLRHLAEQGLLTGAIGDFISRAWLDPLRRDKVSFVGLGQWQDAGMACVTLDLETMAAEALEVFRSQGVASVAFLGPSGPSGSASLGGIFREMTGMAGLSFRLINDTTGAVLGNTLRDLPLPAGLLCFSDHLARLSIQTAIHNGLQVPRDIAVIGVGNSVLESLQAGIGISSFEPPNADIGREAGRLMAGLLEGARDTPLRRIAPKFIPRESSLRSDSGVARMMSFLSGNPDTDANAGELARIAGMSRRSLEKALKALHGETPGSLLQRIRRERAEQLLRTSDLPIAQVAIECGYREPALFSTAFKRWTGKSPRDFRKM